VNGFPQERYLTFFGPLYQPLTTSLRTALCGMVNEGANKITILFASEGGSTDDGIALYSFMTALPVELTMHAVGFVSSIAIPVFLSSPVRFASKNALFFFHEYSWTQQAGKLSQTTMTEQSLLLDTATSWSKDIIKATTKLTDSDFERMKLFDHPQIMDLTCAATAGLIMSVREPKIPATSQPRVVI
jgi:ATP-dependent protease ClpP protease subunit